MRCGTWASTPLDIPITPEKVWQVLQAKGVAE